MALLFFLLTLMQDQPSFRAGVALVHVDAEVRQGGQLIDGLAKEDFVVADNGKSRPVSYFAHQEEPLDVLLLFDTSSSMRPVVERAASAAHSALNELRPGDRIAVMAFDCRTDLIMDFSADFAGAEHALAADVLARQFRGCSPTLKALADAAGQFSRQPSADRRRAIVIVTDDYGTQKRAGVENDLWKADAVVLGVIVRPRINIHIGPPYVSMRDLATKTGGEWLNTADPAEGIHEVIHRLRSRYALYYPLPAGRPGESRKIKVQLSKSAAAKHPGATVRARTGYVQ